MGDNRLRTGTQANHSAGKMLTIIEYLADQREPVRLLDIATELKMNASTALRFINTLIDTGYAKQNLDTSRYSLTYKICAIGNKVSSHINIREAARPYMKRLSELFGELVCLAVEQDRNVVYIETMEGQSQMLRAMQRIGNIAPMHCTGIGKLLLLNYSEQDLDDLIEEVGLKKFTENTITEKKQLMEILKSIRKQGYAYDNEECEIGARCLAFPVFNATGKIIAGISVTGPVNRLTNSYIDSRINESKEIINGVTREMGGNI